MDKLKKAKLIQSVFDRKQKRIAREAQRKFDNLPTKVKDVELSNPRYPSGSIENWGLLTISSAISACEKSTAWLAATSLAQMSRRMKPEPGIWRRTKGISIAHASCSIFKYKLEFCLNPLLQAGKGRLSIYHNQKSWGSFDCITRPDWGCCNLQCGTVLQWKSQSMAALFQHARQDAVKHQKCCS